MLNSDSESVREYYNDHIMRKLIRDYVNGNPRFDKAVACVINCGRRSFAKILDIGCGIGYSSSLLKAAFPNSTVLGLDVSDLGIQTAEKLFQVDGLRFECKDFLTEKIGGSYDLIVMIDVYEHFPLQQRRLLNKKLDGLLAEDGWIVITTPTIAHQRFLREKHPDRLQIIDEDVSEEDLLLLSRDTQTAIVLYEKVAVWNTYDYQHYVARRYPDFGELSPPIKPGWIHKFASKVKRIFKSDPKHERCTHIRRALKIDPVELIENGKIVTVD